MKHIYFTLFCLGLLVSGLTAQGTLVGANLNGTAQFPFTFLDQFVEANNGGMGSDNLYLLEPGGSYFFTSRATWDFNVEFRANGAGDLPIIGRVNLAGDPPQDMYRGFGDLVFVGVHLVPGDEGPEASQYETGSIRPSGDNAKTTFRNCVIEKDRQAVLRMVGTNTNITFQSCEIRNLGDFEAFQGNGRVVDPRETFPDSVIIKDCYIHNLLDRVYIGFRQLGVNYFEFSGNTVYNHVGRHGLIQLKNAKETIIKNNLFINPMIQGSKPDLANEQILHLNEQIYLFTIDSIVEGASIDMTNNNVFWTDDVENHYATFDSVTKPNILSPLFAAQLANPDDAFFSEVIELNNVPDRAPLIAFARESIETRASSGLTNIMVEPANLNTNPDNPNVFNFAEYDPCYSESTQSGTAATDGGALGARWACNYSVNVTDRFYNTSLNLSTAPNPASTATTISYQTFETGKVNLTIFDVSGRPVTTLVNAEQLAGPHTINWDEVANVPAGMYFANLQTTSGRMFIRIVVN